jgi:RNA polymerase sigma factor (sigma-70 family)
MCSNLLQELYQSARLGNSKALNELLASLRPRLHAVAARIVPQGLQPKIDSSDVVQNTLKDAFEGFQAFPGATVHEFWAWLCAIHRNNARSMVTHYKSQRRDFTTEVSLENCPNIESGAVRANDASVVEHQEIRYKAFQQLSRDDQAILKMKAIDGMEYRQIAASVGESETTIRKRYSRALIRWSEKIQQLR